MDNTRIKTLDRKYLVSVPKSPASLFAMATIFGVTLFMASCGGPESSKDAKPAAVQSMNASKRSDVFNAGMSNLINGYDTLKNGLIDYDTVKANEGATLVVNYLDSLPLAELVQDSGATQQASQGFAEGMKRAARALVKDTTLEAKKKHFEQVSADFYQLIKSVKYDRQVIYHQHCPMAFNDEKEAWWVSTSPQIRNPYLGSKHPKYKDAMLSCGDVTDTLDFSK